MKGIQWAGSSTRRPPPPLTTLNYEHIGYIKDAVRRNFNEEIANLLTPYKLNFIIEKGYEDPITSGAKPGLAKELLQATADAEYKALARERRKENER